MTVIDPIEVGDAVTYVDEFGKPHKALVTAVHGTFPKHETYTQEEVDEMSEKYESDYSNLLGKPHTVPSVNLIHVSTAEDQTDQYGRQITRPTSVVHRSSQTAHGRYWQHLG